MAGAAAQHLLVGHRPWQRGDERLLLLPVRLAVLLAVGACCPQKLAALPDGAAAGAQVRAWRAAVRICTCCRYVKNAPITPCWVPACTRFPALAVYNVFFNHFVDVVALFPVSALGAGRGAFMSRNRTRPVRLLGGGQPAQQLFLLCGTGHFPVSSTLCAS